LQFGLDWANHVEVLQQIPPCAQVGYARRGGGLRLRLNPSYLTDLYVGQNQHCELIVTLAASISPLRSILALHPLRPGLFCAKNLRTINLDL
jgi:hypothetical protein